MNVVVSAHTVAIDAYIVKGRLEAEGIPAFLVDDQYITMDWLLSVALGGVKVSVPLAYRDAALEIIQNTENDEYQIDKLDCEALAEEPAAQYIPEVPLECPKCHSYKISRLEWMRHLSLIVVFFVHAPIAFSQRYYTCDDCGHVFRADKSSAIGFTRTVIAVLSILVAMAMVFVLVFSGFPQDTYLSRSNGGDMALYWDEGPPADWSDANWTEEETYHYTNPMEGVAREDLPKPDGPY
jgi:hypothetical protein